MTINSSEIKPFHEQKVSSKSECSLLCQQNECLISQLLENGLEYICSLYHYVEDVTDGLQAFDEGRSEIFKLDIDEVQEENEAGGVQEDCSAWYNLGHTQDGVFSIKINGRTIKVFCDITMLGGGWAVFQKRFDGSVNFHRNWHDYKHGFGDVFGEYWLGLESINSLTTTNKPQTELLIWAKSFGGEVNIAQFKGFRVEDENTKYRLTTRNNVRVMR